MFWYVNQRNHNITKNVSNTKKLGLEVNINKTKYMVTDTVDIHYIMEMDS